MEKNCLTSLIRNVTVTLSQSQTITVRPSQLDLVLGIFNKLKNCPMKLCLAFFITANMLKVIFDHIPQFSLSKKNAVLV